MIDKITVKVPEVIGVEEWDWKSETIIRSAHWSRKSKGFETLIGKISVQNSKRVSSLRLTRTQQERWWVTTVGRSLFRQTTYFVTCFIQISDECDDNDVAVRIPDEMFDLARRRPLNEATTRRSERTGTASSLTCNAVPTLRAGLDPPKRLKARVSGPANCVCKLAGSSGSDFSR